MDKEKLILTFLKIFVFVLFPFILVAQIEQQNSQSVDLSKVDIMLDNETDFTKVEPGKFSLSTEIQEIKTSNTVNTLLISNGICPDAGSYSLIYDLNSDIEDINMIYEGQNIVLPKIEEDNGFNVQVFIEQGKHFSIDYKETFAKLNTKRKELIQITNELSEISLNRFSNVELKTNLIQEINNTYTAIETINSNKYPTSKKVINQSTIEADFIIGKIRKAIATENQFSSEFLDSISTYKNFLEEKASDLIFGKSGMVKTLIKTIKKDGDEEKNLRIWYAPVCDRSFKQQCSDLSSPTHEVIARGEYIFWATKVGDQSHVTDEVTRKIRKQNKDIPIELLVKED